MSIPLNEKKRSEAPLIAFTLCTPAAAGIAVLASVLGFWSPEGAVLLMSAASLAFATVGMLASVFHLAKPLRAPFSLRHLTSSWLSREIVAVAVFWAFAAAWLLGCMFANAAVFVAGELLAATSGVVLLFVITRAYKVSTRPAWMGAEGLMELVAAACGAGSSTVLCCIFCAFAFEGEGGVPAVVLAARLAALCVAQAAAFALDVASHRRRRMRLRVMAEESDERIPLTLANYGKAAAGAAQGLDRRRRGRGGCVRLLRRSGHPSAGVAGRCGRFGCFRCRMCAYGRRCDMPRVGRAAVRRAWHAALAVLRDSRARPLRRPPQEVIPRNQPLFHLDKPFTP